MSHCVKLLGKSLQSCPSSKSNDATGDKACIWIAIMRNPETNYKNLKRTFLITFFLLKNYKGLILLIIYCCYGFNLLV